MTEPRDPKKSPKGQGGAASAQRTRVGGKPAGKPVLPGVSPARLAAFELLQRIGQTSSHSDDLLHGPRLAQLSQADRDLTTALVLGVLRWQIALDARVRPFLSRPDLALAESIAIALRLGAFQLLHLERIPAHAALNESVELTRAAGHPHAAGMVNAILRKLAAAPPARRPLVETTAALAERLGHPLWLVERWARLYGRPAAEAICAFDQHEPSCAALFGQDEAGLMPVMDAGSRLVAELAAEVGVLSNRVWDCCAAPGGKTVVLAKRLPQAKLFATDVSPVRLKRLRQRLSREVPDRSITLENADAAQPPASFGEFDLILCDVPCSGTGTLARNPEIRHRLVASDLPRQAERQRRILQGALSRLAPGGFLVYSTCSLEPEECQDVVEDVCGKEAASVRMLSALDVLTQLQASGTLKTEVESVQKWAVGEYLRTLPGASFPGDGFFAAVIQRT